VDRLSVSHARPGRRRRLATPPSAPGAAPRARWATAVSGARP